MPSRNRASPSSSRAAARSRSASACDAWKLVATECSRAVGRGGAEQPRAGLDLAQPNGDTGHGRQGVGQRPADRRADRELGGLGQQHRRQRVVVAELGQRGPDVQHRRERERVLQVASQPLGIEQQLGRRRRPCPASRATWPSAMRQCALAHGTSAAPLRSHRPGQQCSRRLQVPGEQGTRPCQDRGLRRHVRAVQPARQLQGTLSVVPHRRGCRPRRSRGRRPR